MAPIEIPDSYWDIASPGFQAIVAPHLTALANVFDQVNGDYASLTGVDVNDLEQQLGNVDGDAGAIDADVAEQRSAVHSAGTGEVLGQYGAADALADQANSAQNPTPQTQGAGQGGDAPPDTGI